MKPNRRDGVAGGSTQRQNIKLTGETLHGPAEGAPPGGKRIRVEPESAEPTPGRESEIAYFR